MPVFHEISWAEGPFKQTTKNDRLSSSVPPSGSGHFPLTAQLVKPRLPGAETGDDGALGQFRALA
jgi:hypothetical protein